ncbi:hypothetical protein BS50DRAFT_633909 [Corynespora cassiicola Philippines]|uniref:Uncharacterized protein n=1 Tax=Corynespora cassiicola Philippines TaxID=1448308 RepID=A0A2T2NS86_CORCC|nr:hypothetical protein BS50DRAFT_633909 [Corynespora cassiicola Philippines]
MRSPRVLIAVLFAFIATAYALPEFPALEARKHDGDGNNGTSKNDNPLNKACHKMTKLTKLSDLANNQTKLDELMSKGRIDQARVDEIKAKAANVTAELQSMQSNTTLVEECAVVNAHRKDLRRCKKMKRLEKLASMANNDTALVAFTQKKDLNETLIAKLKEKISEATTKLQEMQSNTTLTDMCASQQKQEETQDGANSPSGAAGAEQSAGSSGANGLTAKTLPYFFIPALAAVFTFLL